MRDTAAISFVRNGVMVVHCACIVHSVCGFCPGFTIAGFFHMPRANVGEIFSVFFLFIQTT
jgi:hypothetical protein